MFLLGAVAPSQWLRRAHAPPQGAASVRAARTAALSRRIRRRGEKLIARALRVFGQQSLSRTRSDKPRPKAPAVARESRSQSPALELGAHGVFSVSPIEVARTAGAVSGARRALLHLCRVNGGPSEPYTSGTSLVPGAAIASINRHQTKKTAGITLNMLRSIAEVYCFARPNCSCNKQ